MAELTRQEQLRQVVCDDIWAYAQYVLPHYAFGDIHRDVLRDMGDSSRETGEGASNLLALIPRDHLKSVMAGVYATWKVARNPAYTILYMTADEDLGRLQMAFMKSIFEGERFRYLFPDHFDPEAGKREKWTGLAISSTHPLRKEKNVRDETIVCKTVKAGKTGRHPNEIIYDDLVVPENAYSELGRSEVRKAASQAASLISSGGTGGMMTAVGTTYHLSDQYALWKSAKYEVYDDEGNWVANRPFWKVIEHKVENAGDGSGDYLWPRQITTSGEWYGFNRQALARKKAEYELNGELTQFHAQYYMEPNDPGSHRVSADQFVYGDRKYLEYHDGVWFYSGRRLNVMAAMDTAITDAASEKAIKADYTAIVIIGHCEEGFYYILAMDQFQTDKRKVYYEHLISLWKVWEFQRVYIEMEQAGKVIAEGIKEQVRKDGYNLVVDGNNAPRGIAKHERHASITIPKYENGSVYHFKGGYTAELEEQVTKPRPAHDDLLDCVTMGIQEIKKPQKRGNFFRKDYVSVIPASGRFGGRRRA